jgi:outer membrane lipoprotein carrier protein
MKALARMVVGAVAMLAAGIVTAGGDATALDRYLNGLVSLQADFTQTTHDARGRLVESGKGQLIVQRPGRFRWEFKANGSAADEGQLLIADGKNLWFYERELAQVTVRDASTALGATPVVLLSGTASEVQASFSVSQLPGINGTERVSIVPQSAAADFSRAELSWRGATLLGMQITDKLGQSIDMKFSKSLRNKAVSASLLKFVVPAGVDVIGTALP